MSGTPPLTLCPQLRVISEETFEAQRRRLEQLADARNPSTHG